MPPGKEEQERLARIFLKATESYLRKAAGA